MKNVLDFFSTKKSIAQKKVWESAMNSNTAESYRHYIDLYPEGKFHMEARQRLFRINEESAWAYAQKVNTFESYDSYRYNYHHTGKYVEEARKRMKDLKKDEKNTFKIETDSTISKLPDSKPEHQIRKSLDDYTDTTLYNAIRSGKITKSDFDNFLLEEHKHGKNYLLKTLLRKYIDIERKSLDKSKITNEDFREALSIISPPIFYANFIKGLNRRKKVATATVYFLYTFPGLPYLFAGLVFLLFLHNRLTYYKEEVFLASIGLIVFGIFKIFINLPRQTEK